MARKASRVAHRLRSPVSRELAGLSLWSGGHGAFIVAAHDRRGDDGHWVSHAACDALVRASARLAFGEEYQGWFIVVAALAAGCLVDLQSEAIEEQETEYGECKATKDTRDD